MRRKARQNVAVGEQDEYPTPGEDQGYQEGVHVGMRRGRKASPATLKFWGKMAEEFHLEGIESFFRPEQLQKDIDSRVDEYGRSFDVTAFAAGWMRGISLSWNIAKWVKRRRKSM